MLADHRERAARTARQIRQARPRLRCRLWVAHSRSAPLGIARGRRRPAPARWRRGPARCHRAQIPARLVPVLPILDAPLALARERRRPGRDRLLRERRRALGVHAPARSPAVARDRRRPSQPCRARQRLVAPHHRARSFPIALRRRRPAPRPRAQARCARGRALVRHLALVLARAVLCCARRRVLPTRPCRAGLSREGRRWPKLVNSPRTHRTRARQENRGPRRLLEQGGLVRSQCRRSGVVARQ
jgi:hypothetical protein